jgi:hypothetical protein
MNATRRMLRGLVRLVLVLAVTFGIAGVIALGVFITPWTMLLLFVPLILFIAWEWGA